MTDSTGMVVWETLDDGTEVGFVERPRDHIYVFNITHERTFRGATRRPGRPPKYMRATHKSKKEAVNDARASLGLGPC